MRLDRVVIGTDFSAASVEAAKWTAEHFAYGAQLVLVHVVSVPEPPRFFRGRYPAPDALVETARAGAEARLRELGRALGAERLRVEVRVGRPAEELAAAAADHNADVIAVGRHGERPGVWHRLGSTADALVRAATVPVLLATRVRDVRPRRILVALDESDATGAVASWARALGDRFDAYVLAVHVVSSAVVSHLFAAPGAGADGGASAEQMSHDEAREGLRRDADRWIEGLVGTGAARERVSSEVAFGEPGQEILAAAERHESELIVVGSHGAGRARRFIAGSVASEVLRGATCPVLVVVPPVDEIED